MPQPSASQRSVSFAGMGGVREDETGMLSSEDDYDTWEQGISTEDLREMQAESKDEAGSGRFY